MLMDWWERYRKGLMIAGVLLVIGLSFWGYSYTEKETEMPLTPPAYLSGGEMGEAGGADQVGWESGSNGNNGSGRDADSNDDNGSSHDADSVRGSASVHDSGSARITDSSSSFGNQATSGSSSLTLNTGTSTSSSIDSAQKNTTSSSSPDAQSNSHPMYVDLKGRVKTPGVYTFSENDRIQSVITQAGGFLPDADTKLINLALPLQDGMVIYIPSTKETSSANNKTISVITLPNQTAQAGQATGQPPDALSLSAANSSLNSTSSPTSSSASSTATGKVNLNTATADQLMTLPGIGKTKADAILAYRSEHGGFLSADELKKINGIGEKTYVKLAPKIAVE